MRKTIEKSDYDLLKKNRYFDKECFEITLTQLLVVVAVLYGFMWCCGAALGLAFKGMGL